MKSTRFMALGVLAAILACVLGVQLTFILTASDPIASTGSRARPVVPAVQTLDTADRQRRQTLADAILARPLFNDDRRPVAPIAMKGSGPASLPRLTGIVISGADRSAIFAAASDSGKQVVAHEGAQIGQFTVKLIQAELVTVIGPGGAESLRPTFDQQRVAAKADAPIAAVAPGPALLNLPSLPELLLQQHSATGR